MSVAPLAEPEVLVPASEEEAIAAFGDGTGVTVLGGGTILMPELAAGRLKPEKTILLARAGLDEWRDEGGTTRIGAAVSVGALVDAPEPLASAARHVADYEVRSQGTLGGNLCAGPGRGFPRGDLQAPLIALDAYVRSAGAGGERTEPVERFLSTSPGNRLVVQVEFETRDRLGGWAALERPHAHSYTALSVAATISPSGSDLRVACSGAGPYAVRLRSVEQGGLDGDPGEALRDVQLTDDALASAWYRERMLPVLVGRVLSQLKEAG